MPLILGRPLLSGSNVRWTILLAAVSCLGPAASGQTCPNPPVPTIASPQPPVDACIPDGVGFAINYFDDYSWRAFVAMVWPAATGQRGVPDLTRKVGDPGPRVFETYKSLWEVFHLDGSGPTSKDFNQYETSAHNGCDAPVSFGDIVLASVSKFDDVGQAGGGSDPVPVGPVVAQNGRYVRYLAQYNWMIFDTIFQNKFFLRANLPADESSTPVQFRNGSISIKSAWIDLTDFSPAQQRRYHTLAVWVRDPVTKKCSRATVGLVGLHIVQKTPHRPQWIWSTFEQVDNVPPTQSGSAGLAFNDGTAKAMPVDNPLKLTSLAPEPVPSSLRFNVTRSNQIRDETAATNKKYQSLLAGTVWNNYQLVMTQWPQGPSENPNQATLASQAGDITHTFPGVLGTTSSFANPVIETFYQDDPRSSCMACHNNARIRGDFLWSMLTHAFPTAQAPDGGAGGRGGNSNGSTEDVSLRALRTLIMDTQAARRSRAAPATPVIQPQGKQ